MKRFDGWHLFIYAVSLLVIVPLSVVLLSFLSHEKDIWEHLLKHQLPRLLTNTFWLVSGVAGLTTVLGVSLAWLTAVCDFPGRRFFSWALLLPLAIPTYVLAFVFLGVFDFTGPVQSAIRDWTGNRTIGISDIRSTGGVITIMSLALYPYIYLITRNAFVTQGKKTLEVTQSLGYNRFQGFFKVALPMARPWIAGGVMLVLMETLADFGAVSIFNYDTFTTAIYKAWFGFFSIEAAAQLSSILVILVFIIILTEQSMRSRMRYHQPGRTNTKTDHIKLTGMAAWASFFFASSVLCIAFIIPFVQLILWTAGSAASELNDRYFGFLTHTLYLGLMGSAITCLCALLLSYAKRHIRDRESQMLVRISTMGYALPGTILAVGIFIPVSYIDSRLVQFMSYFISIEPGPLLQGTLLVMITAYLIRFLAPGFNAIDSSMQRITRSIDEASRIFGIKGLIMLKRVHIPILKSGIATALTLVFIDVMKEMPITLMTRPFGWDTLAVKIFELTSEGEWERAALPAVTLIIAGLIPILFFRKHMEE